MRFTDPDRSGRPVADARSAVNGRRFTHDQCATHVVHDPPSTTPITDPPITDFGSPTRYLSSSGGLPVERGSASEVVLEGSAGQNHDGTPYQATTFTATGLTASYHGGSTAFAFAVDSGTAVGNAAQIRVSYDLTGDGSWDRVETYRYFATDPIAGAENYTQQVGLRSADGTLGDLADGSVKVEIWSALTGAGGSGPTIRASSSITLPFS